MRGIEGEQVLLRVIVSESGRAGHQALFLRIIEVLREEGLAGATAVKGIAGFGHDRHVHTDTIEVLAQGLPIVVEVVDTQAHIDRVLPRLEALLEGGVMMTERAHVIRYVKS
jgi:PII-like signaling protein